jgi:hypothetical protein
MSNAKRHAGRVTVIRQPAAFRRVVVLSDFQGWVMGVRDRFLQAG